MRVDEIFRNRTLDRRMAEYRHRSVALAKAVSSEALQSNALEAEHVDAVICASCTGYMMPSIDVHLVADLGLRPDVRRIPLTEIGCSAGVSAISLASDLIRSGSAQTALVVAAELCSLTLQESTPSPADVFGALLFGDGAAGVTITRDGPGIQIVAARSVVWPRTVEHLGMALGNSGLRLVLSSSLPSVIRQLLRPTVESFLDEHHLVLGNLSFFAVHPGGPKILSAISRSLELTDEAVAPSWDVWRRFGNMSSATILFILRELQLRRVALPDSLGLMLALGPGVSCEMLLLRWSDGIVA
jgi:alkylresorcinol/alkylpyrone synthase